MSRCPPETPEDTRNKSGRRRMPRTNPVRVRQDKRFGEETINRLRRGPWRQGSVSECPLRSAPGDSTPLITDKSLYQITWKIESRDIHFDASLVRRCIMDKLRSRKRQTMLLKKVGSYALHTPAPRAPSVRLTRQRVGRNPKGCRGIPGESIRSGGKTPGSPPPFILPPPTWPAVSRRPRCS